MFLPFFLGFHLLLLPQFLQLLPFATIQLFQFSLLGLILKIILRSSQSQATPRTHTPSVCESQSGKFVTMKSMLCYDLQVDTNCRYKVLIKDLASALGVSGSWASQLVRKGMPTTSTKAALDWNVAQNSYVAFSLSACNTSHCTLHAAHTDPTFRSAEFWHAADVAGDDSGTVGAVGLLIWIGGIHVKTKMESKQNLAAALGLSVRQIERMYAAGMAKGDSNYRCCCCYCCC